MEKPNVIIIYADDLGFGDLSCYGASELRTPHLDRLAEQSLKFTNAHAAAATCTPSRYSLLTGNYPWRAGTQIADGDSKLVIEPGSPTLPALFKKAGYTTGIVGKWHLGLGITEQNWNGAMEGTPLDVGFDYSFILPATNDRVPCVYLEGRHVVGLDQSDPLEISYHKPFPGEPTGRDNPELLQLNYSHGHDMAIVNGISRIGYMRGGKSALWKDEEMGEVFLTKSLDFITKSQDKPFFLYYALHQPHVPRVPAPQFLGKSGLGPRGDVILELDWCVGQLVQKLEELNLKEDTLIIFSSDNGPVLDDGYQDQAVELAGKHRPAGPFRGGKYSMYEGGTRTPFILHWPRQVKPGTSSALVGHLDLYASFAALFRFTLAEGEAVDSSNLLATFLGRSEEGRKELLTEGVKGKHVLQADGWVYIPAYQGEAVNKDVNIELGNAPLPQLYNLTEDLGQQTNLAQDYPEQTGAMERRLEEILQSKTTR